MSSETTPQVSLPTVIENITESKLSLIRKYICELLILALFFILYQMNATHTKIENEMKVYMMGDRTELIKVVLENTRVMRYYQPPEIKNDTTP